MCQATATVTLRTLMLADIVREAAPEYRRQHKLCGPQDKVLRAIEQCRTEALGSQLQICDLCGAVTVRYHSCRNRHCPQCQSVQQQLWVEEQVEQLLDVPYFHLVFTLPHELNALAQGNSRVMYDLLFQAASATLLAFAADPKWIGGEPGITMVLPTWGQNLGQHIHVHCIVTGGGLSPDGQRWKPARQGFLFPVAALSSVFRGKYLAGLSQALITQQLTLTSLDENEVRSLLGQLGQRDWVVYAKAPWAGPKQVLQYLGRYTQRIALSNQRLVSFENGQVRFRWRDYRHGNQTKIMTLSVDEFLHRFLLHVLPDGLHRIRHYGLLANRFRRVKLACCRALLGQSEPSTRGVESIAESLLRLCGRDIGLCPHCHQGRLQSITERLPQCWPLGTIPAQAIPP